MFIHPVKVGDVLRKLGVGFVKYFGHLSEGFFHKIITEIYEISFDLMNIPQKNPVLTPKYTFFALRAWGTPIGGYLFSKFRIKIAFLSVSARDLKKF